MDREALQLLLECIEAAEDEARELSTIPSHQYTSRAAVIYRRQKDFEAEVNVIQRWINAWPEPQDVDNHLAVRLVRAKRLQGPIGLCGVRAVNERERNGRPLASTQRGTPASS